MQKKDKKKQVRAHHPNAGIMNAYFKALNTLIRKMHKEFTDELKFHYAILHKDVVNDNGFTDWLKRFAGKWLNIWHNATPDLIKSFIGKTVNHQDKNLQKRLYDAGFTVKFKPSEKLNKLLKLAADENAQLISNIPEQYISRLSQTIYQSALAGRDLSSLMQELTKTWGMTRKRAARIALDQNNKLTSLINRTRSLEVGITKGVWIHAGHPKTPRPDHVKAGKDKLVFDLKKGAYISGEYIFPGELSYCGCIYRPVIPGIGENAVHDSQVVNDAGHDVSGENRDNLGRFAITNSHKTEQEKPDEKKEQETTEKTGIFKKSDLTHEELQDKYKNLLDRIRKDDITDLPYDGSNGWDNPKGGAKIPEESHKEEIKHIFPMVIGETNHPFDNTVKVPVILRRGEQDTSDKNGRGFGWRHIQFRHAFEISKNFNGMNVISFLKNILKNYSIDKTDSKGTRYLAIDPKKYSSSTKTQTALINMMKNGEIALEGNGDHYSIKTAFPMKWGTLKKKPDTDGSFPTKGLVHDELPSLLPDGQHAQDHTFYYHTDHKGALNNGTRDNSSVSDNYNIINDSALYQGINIYPATHPCWREYV